MIIIICLGLGIDIDGDSGKHRVFTFSGCVGSVIVRYIRCGGKVICINDCVSLEVNRIFWYHLRMRDARIMCSVYQ